MNEEKARKLIDLIIERVTGSAEVVERKITYLSRKYKIEKISFDKPDEASDDEKGYSEIIRDVLHKIDGLDKALDVLDQRMSKKFKDYSDRCIAMAQLARSQAKVIADLTAEQEKQKESFASLHQEVSSLSESVNTHILSTALQIPSSASDSHEKENRDLKARVSSLQVELERIKEENKLLEVTVAMSSSDGQDKKVAELQELVNKLQSENEKLAQEKSILELSAYSNNNSDEISNLTDQIKKLEKELKETKSQKELLELSASLKNSTTSDAPAEKASIEGLSELLSAAESEESKGGFDVEFSEDDYFYREKNMKAISRAEKLLFLVGGTPSASGTPDPVPEHPKGPKDRRLRTRSSSIVKWKK